MAQYGSYTALMLAAEKGHAESVRALADSGADKDAKNSVRAVKTLCMQTRLPYLQLASWCFTIAGVFQNA